MKAWPTPPKLCKVHNQTQALKTKHTAIRDANAALPPASLERVFAKQEMP